MKLVNCHHNTPFPTFLQSRKGVALWHDLKFLPNWGVPIAIGIGWGKSNKTASSIVESLNCLKYSKIYIFVLNLNQTREIMISLTVLLQTTAEHASKMSIQNVASQHLSFFELLMKGGVILIPIGILSLISIYLIAEKYFYIHKTTQVSAKLRSDFKAALQKGELDKAVSVLKTEKGAYSAIFIHAVKDFDQPAEEIEKEIENVSNIEVSKIGKNLNYLGLIAGIAPMLGFIGTIAGIIKIFYSISVTDNISIGVISAGLYEKMISSGSGLIVGVIAYTGYHLLNMIVDKFISLVEADSFDVLNIKKGRK